MNRKLAMLTLAGAVGAACLFFLTLSFGTSAAFEWIHSLSPDDKAILRFALLLMTGAAVLTGVWVRRKSRGPSEL